MQYRALDGNREATPGTTLFPDAPLCALSVVSTWPESPHLTSLALSVMAPSFDLGAPVNTALLIYILYSVQRILLPSVPAAASPEDIPREFKHGYSWLPKSHPPTVLYKTYTPKTLAPFSGTDGGRILLAIEGTVFDVTAGRNFYGPSE
jgi:hypothetical protein